MRMKAYYAKLFRRQGYKVLELPYEIAGAPHFNEWEHNYKEKGDAFYNYRHDYFNYDVIVSNTVN
jgi:hypothetical protein